MLTFSKRFIYAFSNKIFRKNNENYSGGKFAIDFSKARNSPFDIKSESSYNANLSKGSFTLGLKKRNFISWTEIPDCEYQDHILEAKIRLDSLGGYASTGLLFHIIDDDSYYMALISSKGYFRLDVVKNNSPRALIAWTEISDFDGTNIDLKIITYGTYLIFLVNGKWIGEASDDSINRGRIGFVLASYETDSNKDAENSAGADEYTCKAMLDYFSVDTRIKTIEENFKQWTDATNINAENRLRLVETYAAMGEYSKALDQIDRAWKRREEAARSVSAAFTDIRTKKELLFAARMSFHLGQYEDADEYIDAILLYWSDTAEGKEAIAEKLKTLNALKKFEQLKEFVSQHSGDIEKNIDYYTMLARCHWELKDYKNSAAMWKQAFKIDKENGVYAANAANALELAGKIDEALPLFVEAGKIFLRQDNMSELSAMMPKLSALGEKNWEVRALAGKWAFSIEDYDRCAAELAAANKLRCSMRPRPKADPALYYLWGIVLAMKGRNSDAIRLLERAVRLAPDYGLFRLKLAEIKLECGKYEPENVSAQLAEELQLALKNIDDPEGQMAHHAGELMKKAGDAKGAKYFFDKAKKK